MRMIWDCPVTNSYFYYDSKYYDRFTEDEQMGIWWTVKSWWQLVVAIDSICSTIYGTINKTILVDYISDTFSYIRVDSYVLVNRDWMS